MKQGLRKSFGSAPMPAHGSVLVFVVVLLSVLALLAATTLFLVRQGVKISQNAAQSVESKLAADSGMRHATKVLRDAVTSFTICTPEGVFTPGNGIGTHPWLLPTEPGITPSPRVSPLRVFADDPASLEIDPGYGTATSVPLSALDDEMINFATHRYPGSRFTSSPIIGRDRDNYDYALINRIVGETATFYKGDDAAFAKNNFNARTQPRLSGIRGEYFVWIKDLDAKMYAKSADNGTDRDGWDLDVANTLPATVYQSAYGAGAADETLWKNVIREGVLNYDSADADYPQLMSDTAALTNLYNLATPTQPGFDARAPHYYSTKELATQLDALYDSTDPNNVVLADESTYSLYRAELDLNFTVYKDVRNNNTALLQKQIKNHPAAININTASVEVIAAALSQIPGENDPEFSPEDHTPMTTARCLALARRIVSKRPFLCRMDFEDFLAAQLWGECSFDATGQVLLIEYPDPMPAADFTLPTEQEFIYDLTGGNVPIVNLIHYMIGRRWGRGYTPVVAPLDPVVTPDLNPYRAEDVAAYGTNPEITLGQYLEIPGVPNNAAQFATADGYYPNEPVYQRRRFEFFANDTQGSDLTVTRDMAKVSPREFNNILNSIFSLGQNSLSDDVQVLAVGTLDTGATPNPVITAGPNGVLESVPQGDDTYLRKITAGVDTVLNTVVAGDDYVFGGAILPGLNGVFDSARTGDDVLENDTTAIWPGVNRIAETPVIGTKRPSYYTYTNDSAYAETFWEAIDDALTARKNAPPPPDPAFFASTHILDPLIRVLTVPAGTIEEADREAARRMRLYYRLPLAPGSPTPPPGVEPSADFAQLGHLVSWRCMPRNDELPGFYQMAFDDWTTYTAAPTSYVIGPIQAMGDYDYYTDGIDDEFDVLYSAAKPWSGRIVPGKQFDLGYDGTIDAGVDDTVGNGDVSWSPKFAFRSRFYQVFVLGQGLSGPGSDSSTLSEEALRVRPQGEKRIEAVYDALLDQILWQQSPVTDKRSMSEPPPP